MKKSKHDRTALLPFPEPTPTAPRGVVRRALRRATPLLHRVHLDPAGGDNRCARNVWSAPTPVRWRPRATEDLSSVRAVPAGIAPTERSAASHPACGTDGSTGRVPADERLAFYLDLLGAVTVMALVLLAAILV